MPLAIGVSMPHPKVWGIRSIAALMGRSAPNAVNIATALKGLSDTRTERRHQSYQAAAAPVA
jgi:hypothetical protein